jgi:hypothetical protein
MRKLVALALLALALAGGVAVYSLEQATPPQRAPATTADAPRQRSTRGVPTAEKQASIRIRLLCGTGTRAASTRGFFRDRAARLSVSQKSPNFEQKSLRQNS